MKRIGRQVLQVATATKKQYQPYQYAYKFIASATIKRNNHVQASWNEPQVFEQKQKLQQECYTLLSQGKLSSALDMLQNYFNHLVNVEEADASLFAEKKPLNHILVDALLLSYYGQTLRQTTSEGDQAIQVFEKALFYFNRLSELRAHREVTEKTSEYLQEEQQVEYFACIGVAYAFLEKKNYARAEEAMKRALAIFPNDQRALFALAVIYEQMSNIALAEQTYLKCNDLFGKTDPGLLGDIAWFYYVSKKDLKRAQEFFEKSLKVEPKNAPILFNYATMVLQDMKDLPRAEKLFRKVIEQDKEHEQAYASLGFIALGRGEVEKAKGLYKKAVEIDPSRISAVTNYGICLYSLGETEKAEDVLRGALKLLKQKEQDDTEYPEQEQVDQSTMYPHLQDDKIDQVSLYLTLGNVFYDQDKYDQAEQYYKKTLELSPDHLPVIGNFAILQEKHRKNMPLAETYYDKATKSFLDGSNELLQVEKADFGLFDNIQLHKNNLANYASFLVKQKKQVQKAEQCYEIIMNLIDKQAAIVPRLSKNQREFYLEQNAVYYSNYANLIKNKSPEKAKQYEQQARSINQQLATQ